MIRYVNYLMLSSIQGSDSFSITQCEKRHAECHHSGDGRGFNQNKSIQSEVHISVRVLNAEGIRHAVGTAASATGRNHACYLLVGDSANGVLFKHRFTDNELVCKNDGVATRRVKIKLGSDAHQYLHVKLMSETWVGLDVSKTVPMVHDRKKTATNKEKLPEVCPFAQPIVAQASPTKSPKKKKRKTTNTTDVANCGTIDQYFKRRKPLSASSEPSLTPKSDEGGKATLAIDGIPTEDQMSDIAESHYVRRRPRARSPTTHNGETVPSTSEKNSADVDESEKRVASISLDEVKEEVIDGNDVVEQRGPPQLKISDLELASEYHPAAAAPPAVVDNAARILEEDEWMSTIFDATVDAEEDITEQPPPPSPPAAVSPKPFKMPAHQRFFVNGSIGQGDIKGSWQVPPPPRDPPQPIALPHPIVPDVGPRPSRAELIERARGIRLFEGILEHLQL